MITCGLSERRSLRVIGISAISLRYEPAGKQNCALKDKIIHLAQRYRHYDAGMIYRKLRHAREMIGDKRVEGLNAQADLQVKKHERKEIQIF